MTRHLLHPHHKEHLKKLGLPEPPEHLDIHDHHYKEDYANWKRTLPHASHDELHMKVIGHAWTRESVKEKPQAPKPPEEKIHRPEVHIVKLDHRKELRWILAVLAVIALLLLFQPKAHAQFSKINTIATCNGANCTGANQVGFHAAPFNIRCSTNMNCSDDGSTFLITSSATAGTAWDSLTAPTAGGLTFQMFANGNALFTVKRKTDTLATGSFFDFQNAAGGSLCKLDITGTFSSCSYPYAGLTGTPTLAQALANATHKWLNSYNATTGAFTQTQVASTDLSDFSTTAATTDGQIPIWDTGTSTYIPGDPKVQGLAADGASTVLNPVTVSGYDTAGTPLIHRFTMGNTTPGASDWAVEVRNIPSGTQPVSGTFFQATQPVSCANGATCPVNATLGIETTKVIGTVRAQGNVGGVMDAVIGAAAPANVLAAGLKDTSGNSQAALSDTNGRAFVKLYPDTTTTSYHASKKFAASSTTDVAVLPGNASNKVILDKVTLTCTQTTAGQINVELVKRSAADTVGTSASMTAAPGYSAYASAVSAPLSYTGTGPTVGTAVGDLDNEQIGCMAAATATPNDTYIYRPPTPIILNGTAEQVAINLGGALTGGNITVTFDWRETTTP